MADQDGITLRGRSAAWIVPLTVTSGEITGIGTVIKYPAVSDTKSVGAKSSSASKSEKITAQLADGVTVQASKETKVLDVVTLAEVASGTDGDADKISFTTLQTGKTHRQALMALRGQPVLVCIPSPEAVDDSEEGFDFLIGVVSSEVPSEGKAETIGGIPVEVTGKSYTASSGGATALEVNLASITPISGNAALDPAVLTSGDVTSLLTGQLLIK